MDMCIAIAFILGFSTFMLHILAIYGCWSYFLRNIHASVLMLDWQNRDASACEESSCLRMLLDKRDAWLGPWIPGRYYFET